MMKRIIKKIYKRAITTIVAVASLSACNTDELNDLNVNPAAASELDWKLLFSYGIVTSAENVHVSWRANVGYSALFIQHLASISNLSNNGDKYFRSEDMSTAYFTTMYEAGMKELSEVLRQTGPDGKNPELTNLRAAATVMYILMMHKTTDLYGNVPYFEANKGIEGIFSPKYDPQQAIYTDMLAKLDEAADAFSDTGDALGSSDLIYRGDISLWKKFANSLMLRLAMRVSEADPEMAQDYVGRALTQGVFESNADHAWLQMAVGPNIDINQNGISRVLGSTGNEDVVLSATMIDWLKNNSDPRLMIYSGGIGPFSGPLNDDPAAQQGLPNGSDAADVGGVDPELTFSRVNPLLVDLSDPYLYQSYAEVELLQAEAALRNWGGLTPANAQEHYENGVRAAMQMWEIFDPSFVVTDADVDAYLVANPFEQANGFEMIGEQYWAAQFLNWYEAWANWRRTGFPQLVPVNYPGNVTSGQIPVRLEYPTNEIAINAANFEAGATLPNLFTTSVWWDQ